MQTEKDFIEEYSTFFITKHWSDDKTQKPSILFTGSENIAEYDDNAELLIEVPTRILFDAAVKWKAEQDAKKLLTITPDNAKQ